MGRPYEFDRQLAIERATQVFWQHGYEASSVQDLLDAMRLNRGSLYNCFGDKRSLFLECIRHYSAVSQAQIESRLDAPGSRLENIRALFQIPLQKRSSGDRSGCLVINAITELAPHDEEVARELVTAVGEVEKAFQRALKQAVRLGELPHDSDTLGLARFLNNAWQGLTVMCKTSIRPAVLKDIVRHTLSVLSK